MNLLCLGENIQIKNISIAWDMIENTNNTQRWGFIINSIVWDEDRGYQLTNPTERTEIIVTLSK